MVTNTENNKVRAAITGLEVYLPEYILTNEELSQTLDTSDEWIMTRIGVRERHILKGEGLGASYMGIQAVKKLLEEKNIDPSEIDGVICTTVTPDMIFPSTAVIIANQCGIKNAMCYDMNAACAGFVHALKCASLYVETGFCKKLLIVTTEKMSSIVDYTDRKVSPIFGDAATAVLLEPCTEGNGVMDAILRSDGEGEKYLYMKAGGSRFPASIETVTNKEHFIYQDGKTVFKWAVSKMAEVSNEILSKNGLTVGDVSYLLPHQANIRIIDAVAHFMGLEDKEKVLVNIENNGNTTSSTIPLLMWENKDKFKKGDNLILVSFGAGFAWGSLWIKWAI